jgi:STE24 endopeptidase
MVVLVFYLIVGIIILYFILNRVLEYLNISKCSIKLPGELEGIYDSEKYFKSQKYLKVNYRFSFLTSSFDLMVILVMLYYGGFAFIDNLSLSFTQNVILRALLFFGILMFASDIIATPFDLYDTFVIEQKFGFNKTTPKIYIADKIKTWILGAIIGGGILALIVWFYILTTELFWLYAWILVTVFMLFMTMFYSTLIVPLFNKQKPLEEGELRNEINDFAVKTGFKLDNVFVIDGSKRSTKANAYFSGLGVKKRIVLFDTLIKDLNKEEIVAVLAHEIGHYKKKHTLKGVILSIIETGFTLYLLSFFIGSIVLSNALGSEEVSFQICLIAFGILYSPVSLILGIATNIYSRKNEYAADKFAALNYGALHLQNALKKLSVNNLSNLTPHPIYVFFHYSHPPLLERLRELDKFK